MKMRVYTKINYAVDAFAVLSFAFLAIVSAFSPTTYLVKWPISIYVLKISLAKIWICLALYKIFMNIDAKRKQSLIALIVLVLSVIASANGYLDYSILAILSVVFFDYDFDKIVLVYSTSMSTLLIVTLILVWLGVIKNKAEVVPGRLEKSYFLGFIGHNEYMILLFFVMLSLLYLTRKSKYRSLVWIFSFILLFVIWRITDSNTSFVIATVVIAALFVNQILRRNCRRYQLALLLQDLICKVIVLTPVLSVFSTAAGVLFYNKYQRTIVDNNMISRYDLLDVALEKVGVKLPYATIGIEEFDATATFNWLVGTGDANYYSGDILYGTLFLQGGLLLLGVYVFIHVFALCRLYRNKQYVLFLVIAAVVVFGNIESTAVAIHCSIFEFFYFTNIINIEPKKT